MSPSPCSRQDTLHKARVAMLAAPSPRPASLHLRVLNPKASEKSLVSGAGAGWGH